MLAKRTARSGLAAAVGVSLVLVLPSLVRVFIEKSPFGGDQSQYASATLELYRSWALGPGSWAKAMLDSMGFKAPGIAWLGQWFVPLAHFLKSMDAALLLSIVATKAIALLLVFRALWLLSGRSVLVPAAGCLLIATGPLYQYVSLQYLVEPLQLLVVAWFVLIMSCAPRWGRAFVLAQLVAAASVALLAKISSPLYTVGPALVAAAFVLGIAPGMRDWGWRRPATIIAWIAAALLLGWTVGWYSQHLELVLAHARVAATGPVAAVWGKQDTFFNTLGYWIDASARFLFLTPSLVVAALVVAWGIVRYRHRPGEQQAYFTLCCVVSVLQLVVVLAAFSFASNREPRYLVALLPYLALVTAWGIAQASQRAVTVIATSVLAAVWVAAAGHGLRLFDVPARAFGPVPRAKPDGRNAAIIREIVMRTCNDTEGAPYYNVLAIDPTLKGDWLAPAPADYVAAREHLRSHRTAPCSYGYIGDRFFGNDAQHSWSSLLEKRPRFVVTVDPAVYPPSGQAYNQALNKQNFPVLIENLRTSGDFDLYERLPIDPGILIFRQSRERSQAAASAQSGMSRANLERTRTFFGLISSRTLGDVHGAAELRDAGILIHPGATTPTRVTFDIAGKYESLTIAAFIAKLPPEALAIETAGTAGVEIFVDGRSVWRASVDRRTAQETTLDLRSARTLSVAVDNSDGSPWWDWLHLTVK